MATALAENAKYSFADCNFQLAVDLYTQAISLDPQNSRLFADRAQAYIKLQNFTEAVADANKAIELDPSNVKAYYQKANACMRLGENQTAKAAVMAGNGLEKNNSRFTYKEYENYMSDEIVNTNESMEPNPSHSSVPTYNGSKASNITTENLGDSEKPNSDSNQKRETELVQPKYRHAFYQKPEEVVVTIFAKGVPAKSIVIEFGEQIFSVIIDIPGEQPYNFQPLLFEKIVPDKCRYEVLSTKVEIRLAKAEAINWSSLENNQEFAVKQTYSSSGKRKGVDEAAEIEKMSLETYENVDEDGRRAINKSYEKEEELDEAAEIEKMCWEL